MDEPTAALSAHEVTQLFRQVRHLTASGVAVLFISHRLDEVFEIADRVTVLRDGQLISSRPKDEVTPQRAIQDMVGREMSEFFARTEHPRGHLALRVTGIGRADAFADVSFEVHKGEVLGFAGLVGAGRSDVALALFGIAPADTGSVELDGRPVVIRSPREALRHGIAYLSEDRRHLGLSLPQSVTANVTLATLDRYVTRLKLVDSSAERAVADRFRRRLSIRTPRWRRRSSGCREATSRRPCSPSGSTPSRPCSSSTSPPEGSTSAPRPRSITSSTSWPAPAWRSS
jgi:rhamnose transport system ATP-binding protein